MKKLVLTAIVTLFFMSFSPLRGQWAITIGDTSDEEASCVIQTREGDYVVAGSNGVGSGNSNFWILKFDKSGKVIWQKTIDGGNNDKATSIQQTQDGGFIVVGNTVPAGTDQWDIWVLKLSKNGNPLWQKTYGGSSDDSAASVQETIDGGFIIAGTTSSTGTGSSEIWVLKLAHDGTVEWGKTYGGTGEDEAYSLQKTADGGYIVAGRTTSFGAGASDFWILKLTSEGRVDWQRTYGGASDDVPYSIQETIDGGFIAAGSTRSFGASGSDFFVIKMSDRGKVQWQKAYGGTGEDASHSVRQARDGGYIVAGNSDSFGTESGWGPGWGYSDILILKLDPNGTSQWQKTYGGNYSVDDARSIQETADGGYIAAGSTNSWGAGGKDFLVLKLHSNGEIGPHYPFIKIPSVIVTDTGLTKITTTVEPTDTPAEPHDTNISAEWTHTVEYALGTAECVLTMSSGANGTVDPAVGSHTYADGTEVTLNATPNKDYTFDNWSGNIRTVLNPVTIIMDGNKSITASFGPLGDWGGGGGGGGSYSKCFIATSVYGSSEHSQVRVLRDFRDTFLAPTKLGRRLIGFYYKHSPSIAAFIADHKFLRITGRIVLFPIVALSFSALKFGPVPTTIALIMIFMLPVFFIWRRRRKTKRLGKKETNETRNTPI